MSISTVLNGNANYLRTTALTHKQKVLSLYKEALRDLMSWELPDRASYRYKAVLLRQRFEENKDIVDMRKAKILLLQGNDELYEHGHYKPFKFDYSPGGICYERYLDYNDMHLDYWHPIAKAQYPHYFAKREQRKIEFLKMWETRHNKPAALDMGITEHGRYQDEPATEDEKKYGPFTDQVTKA
ncbi:NADH dehydrogenase [ubiquinone] 1 beta subcomplex subunit 9 [Halotydeus destructor]|nr:NADH dehydrogenase [ubiquinone] 1 beta subcomplex subunit 9 [Halotydeus destructor]